MTFKLLLAKKMYYLKFTLCLQYVLTPSVADVIYVHVHAPMVEEEGLFPPSNPSSLSPQPESADNDQIRGKVEEREKEKAAKILCPIKAPSLKAPKRAGPARGSEHYCINTKLAPLILVMIT